MRECDPGAGPAIRRAWRLLAAVTIAGALAGCATPGAKHATLNQELQAAPFSCGEGLPAAGVFGTYRITPGDQLNVLYQLNTWQPEEGFALAVNHTVAVKFPKHPELNETELVRPDGRISLPYLGEVSVAGMTVEELARELRTQYEKVLKDPDLYVVVPDFRTASGELKQDPHTAPRGLSRLVTVRADGYATFAMLGDVRVAGRTLPEVSDDLNARYSRLLHGMRADLFLDKSDPKERASAASAGAALTSTILAP